MVGDERKEVKLKRIFKMLNKILILLSLPLMISLTLCTVVIEISLSYLGISKI